MGMLFRVAFEELIKFLPPFVLFNRFGVKNRFLVLIIPIIGGIGELLEYVFIRGVPLENRIPALFLHLATGVILYIAFKYSWGWQVRGFVINFILHSTFNLTVIYLL